MAEKKHLFEIKAVGFEGSDVVYADEGPGPLVKYSIVEGGYLKEECKISRMAVDHLIITGVVRRA